MKKDNQQQPVAAPVMQVADQLTEKHGILQVDNLGIGSVGNRLVDQLHHQPGCKQRGHQHDGHPAQSPGQRKSQGSFGNCSRAEMQDQAVKQVAVALPINGFLVGSGKNRIPDSLKNVEPVRRRIYERHRLVSLRFYNLEIPVIWKEQKYWY